MVIRLADGSLGLVIGALVLARILTIALPRMSLYLDRIVWVVILVGPAVNREWTPALIGVALWAAWIVVAETRTLSYALRTLPESDLSMSHASRSNAPQSIMAEARRWFMTTADTEAERRGHV